MKSGKANIRARSGLVAALDVGTTKVCCLIARADGERGLDGNPSPRIVGIGHQGSSGMRKGTIIDLDQAEASIRVVVEAAEQMAGENIDRVIVNLSGGRHRSKLIAYQISIDGHEINDADIRRVLDPANMSGEKTEDREFIHTIPVGYTVDGSRGVVDPRGLFGERLGVNTHVITALRGPLRNLENAVSRCHLAVEDVVVSPYASALGCLSEDEKNMGVTCIDMGGGTTSAAVFFDGELVHSQVLQMGGEHVTNDISRGLVTPLVHAERMKTLFGNALPSVSDDQQLIQVPPMGDELTDEGSTVPRSMLVGIVRPRIEEILEQLRDLLASSDFDKVAGRGLVLTGGASQLAGVAELASRILNKQVRLGRPLAMGGMPEAATGPTFATCRGLLQYGLGHRAVEADMDDGASALPRGRIGRIGQWLRENF